MDFKLRQRENSPSVGAKLDPHAIHMPRQLYRYETSMKTSSFLCIFLLCLPCSANAQTLEELIANGILPKTPLPPTQTIPILNRVRDGGTETSVFLSTRAPGTRTPIHKHDEAGVTCLIEGQMTLFIDNQAPATTTAPGCYFMPSNTRMAGMNTGHSSAVFYDFFEVSPGRPHWTLHDKMAPAGAERQLEN